MSSPEGAWGNFACSRSGHVWYFRAKSQWSDSLAWRYPVLTRWDLVDADFWLRASDAFASAHGGIGSEYETFVARERMYSQLWRSYLRRLQVGDAAAEAAIVFLEADPWCPYSGYEKQRVMRFVSRQQLSSADKHRLQRVVLAVTAKGPRWEFAQTALMAKRLWDDDFAADLVKLVDSNPSTRDAVDQLFRKRFTR